MIHRPKPAYEWPTPTALSSNDFRLFDLEVGEGRAWGPIEAAILLVTMFATRSPEFDDRSMR